MSTAITLDRIETYPQSECGLGRRTPCRQFVVIWCGLCVEPIGYTQPSSQPASWQLAAHRGDVLADLTGWCGRGQEVMVR
jgi:hypothetical protein